MSIDNRFSVRALWLLRMVKAAAFSVLKGTSIFCSNNVTTLTTNGGLSTLPPPPKTAPSLPNSIPPGSTKQPSPSPSPSPPIATTTTKPPTPPPVPPQTPPSAQPPAPTAKMSPGGVIKNFFKCVRLPHYRNENDMHLRFLNFLICVSHPDVL